MNRPRIITFGIIATVLTVVAISTLAFLHFREPWAVRAYNRIELGMTAAEVEAAVGVPPTFVFTNGAPWVEFSESYPEHRPRRLVQSAGNTEEFWPGDTIQAWRGPDYGFDTVLNKDGKTKGKVLVLYQPPPVFQRVRAWLGL